MLADPRIDLPGLVASLADAERCLLSKDVTFESGQHRDTGRSEILGMTWREGHTTLRYAFSQITWIPAMMSHERPAFSDAISGPAAFPTSKDARARLRRVSAAARAAQRPVHRKRAAASLAQADHLSRCVLALALSSGWGTELVICCPGIGNRLIHRGQAPDIDPESEVGRHLVALENVAKQLPFGVRLVQDSGSNADVRLERLESNSRESQMSPVEIVRAINDMKDLLK